jgi:hypothetical protein
MAISPTGLPEPTGVPADEMLDALREALRHHLTTANPNGDLDRMMRRFAREARAKGMRAEHALNLLHSVWDSVPEARREGSWLERQSILRRLVVLCLDHYLEDE